METVIAFLLGLMAGLVAFALVLPTMNKRVRAQHGAELEQYEQALAELRQERADDRETNRRLRRELAINTPHSFQTTKEERDRAIEELDKLNTELRQATSELAERDRSLREARLAIHDIRVQLERDRFAMDGGQEGSPVPDGDGPDPDADHDHDLGWDDDGYRSATDGHHDGSPDSSLLELMVTDDDLVDEDDLIGEDPLAGERPTASPGIDPREHTERLGSARFEIDPGGGGGYDERRPGASRFFGDYPVGGASAS